MFDVATPERSASRNNKTVWWEEDDWGLVLNVSTDRKVLTRHMITFRKLVSMYRRGEETHHLRLHKPALIKRLLKEAGFSVTILDRFDTLQLPEGLVGFLARKR